MGIAPFRRTAVVEGPLAFQMRRLAAARDGECGLQIFNLPQVAARLAGGFLYPITPELLEPAIQAALDQGGFSELDRVRALPGMTRAVARTLRHAWNADIDLGEVAKRDCAARLSDLAKIEHRVREQIPPAAMLPRDIRTAALDEVHRAPAALGPVRIERLSWIGRIVQRVLQRGVQLRDDLFRRVARNDEGIPSENVGGWQTSLVGTSYIRCGGRNPAGLRYDQRAHIACHYLRNHVGLGPFLDRECAGTSPR